MSDAVVHLSGAALRRSRFSAPLGRSLYRATIARSTRRALDELPDNLLKDIGLTRSEIPFVAGELAFETGIGPAMRSFSSTVARIASSGKKS